MIRNGNYDREVEIVKRKNEAEILELKTTVTERTSAIESTSSRADETEERI